MLTDAIEKKETTFGEKPVSLSFDPAKIAFFDSHPIHCLSSPSTQIETGSNRDVRSEIKIPSCDSIFPSLTKQQAPPKLFTPDIFKSSFVDPALRHVKKKSVKKCALNLRLSSPNSTVKQNELKNASSNTFDAVKFLENGYADFNSMKRVRNTQETDALKMDASSYTQQQAENVADSGEKDNKTVTVWFEPRTETSRTPSLETLFDELQPPPAIEWWDMEWLMPINFETAKALEFKPTIKSYTPFVVYGQDIDMPNSSNYKIDVQTALNTSEKCTTFLDAKKKRKKEKRRRRKEKAEAQRVAIRQGKIEPPPPKLTMKNINEILRHRKMGYLDPTAREKLVMEDQARRIRSHEERNASKKLSKEERSEKTRLKRTREASTQKILSIFKVLLSETNRNAHIHKIVLNGRHLHITGVALFVAMQGVVILEAGQKPTAKMHRLMVHRMKDKISTSLVFQGVLSQARFKGFERREFSHGLTARMYLRDRGYESAWETSQRNMMQN